MYLWITASNTPSTVLLFVDVWLFKQTFCVQFELCFCLNGGAAFFDLVSNISIVNSVVEGNFVDNGNNTDGSKTIAGGSAIYIYPNTVKRIFIVKTKFIGNQALGGFGGAFLSEAASDDFVLVHPTFVTSTFRNNSATFGGGAVFWRRNNGDNQPDRPEPLIDGYVLTL